jgi:hypothetical protein
MGCVTEKKPTERFFHLRINKNDNFVERVDKLRALQRPILSRAEVAPIGRARVAQAQRQLMRSRGAVSEDQGGDQEHLLQIAIE